MKKSFLFGLLLCLSFSAQAVDSVCQAQLDAKDAVISTLERTISNLSLGGRTAPTVSGQWTCEVVCIHSLIGTGWKLPGQLFRSTVLVSGPTAPDAFNSMIQKCEKDNQDRLAFERQKGNNYASASLAGIMTKQEINSDNWESKMVKSFRSEPPVRKFCYQY